MVMLQGWRFHVLPGDSDYETVRMMEEACAIRTPLKTADIVIFTGGTDVNPSLYGEKRHSLTQASDRYRDTKEASIYHACRAKNKFMIGICRGGQFLNVMNGGNLWQHIDNHGRTVHPLLYQNEKNEKFIIPVTSDHHQMMIPTDHGRVWGRANETTRIESGEFQRLRELNLTGKPRHNEDVEIVWYKRSRSLCFQPHPEWGLISCRELFMDCVRRGMMDVGKGA